MRVTRIPYLALSLSLAGALTACTAKSETPHQLMLCVPELYKVSPSALSKPSQNIDEASADALEERALIGHEEVEESVFGYKGTVPVGGSEHFQPLYLMFSASSNHATKADERNLKPVVGSEGLFRYQDDSPIDWAVFEKKGEDYVPWGNCTDEFNKNGGFDCLRETVAGDVMITYSIHRQNLPLYKKVDAYVRQKREDWACNP